MTILNIHDTPVDNNVVLFDGNGGRCKNGGLLPSGIPFVAFDVTVSAGDLLLGGSVILYDSTGSEQYIIRQLYLNGGGTDFSGPAADRNIQVWDGTTVYSVISGTTLQDVSSYSKNLVWGNALLPLPASAKINTPTAAGVDLTAKYSGGLVDYLSGNCVISGLLQQVA